MDARKVSERVSSKFATSADLAYCGLSAVMGFTLSFLCLTLQKLLGQVPTEQGQVQSDPEFNRFHFLNFRCSVTVFK